MVSVCEQMLDMPDVETAVRVGDVFAQLVEHYAEMRDYQHAHSTVERMRSRNIILNPYIDRALMETIYNAVGLAAPESGEPLGAGGALAAGPAEEAEAEIDDEEIEGEP